MSCVPAAVTVVLEPTRNAWVPLAEWFRRHGARVILDPPEQSADLRDYYSKHAHQTWLDDLGIRYVLQSERMGHEVPGMRGIYSHLTPAMRKELTTGLQEIWEASLKERAKLASRSAVPVLDELIAEVGS